MTSTNSPFLKRATPLSLSIPVAGPGFDLRECVDFVNGGGGGWKSLKLLTVKV